MTHRAQEVLDGLAGVTPGPWFYSPIKNGGTYGGGPDAESGYDSFAVHTEIAGKCSVICDTLNADIGEVNEEYDEEGKRAWDAVAERNMAYLSRCSPDTLRPICEAALESDALRAERDEERAVSNALLSWAASHGEEPDILVTEWMEAKRRAEAAESSLAQAKAEVERLLEALAVKDAALEPFAAEAVRWIEMGNARPIRTDTSLTVADLRAARRARTVSGGGDG